MSNKVHIVTIFWVAIFFSIVLSSCKDNAPSMVEETKVPEPDQQEQILPIKQDENKDRDVWQKPQIVIKMLGDLSGKTVADIGAGTGYFTFRFAMEAEKVIAIDIENQFLEIINTFKRTLPNYIQDRIETRLARPDNPLLAEEEVDLIVIINTIGFIEGRKKYLKTLLPGLKEGGQLVILDYKMKNMPIEIAPPKEDRVPLSVIEKELDEAGYDPVISNDTSLDYQYIVFATKPVEDSSQE